jgi:hypothetical protein
LRIDIDHSCLKKSKILHPLLLFFLLTESLLVSLKFSLC